MTLVDLCGLFDQYEIVDTQINIDRDFYSISEKIYTDGDELKTNVTQEAYIHITSVHNANYLMFIDRDHNIYICIYKYIPTTKYKEIVEQLHILRSLSSTFNEYDSGECNICVNDDVIDINEFKCTECHSEEKLKYYRSKTNPEALQAKCDNCKTEYTFVPSKYYKLSSKRIVYFKSEKSSRLIDIQKRDTKHKQPDDNITMESKGNTSPPTNNKTTQEKSVVSAKNDNYTYIEGYTTK